IKTVFPTKCLEYFLSGRPILCHAPSYSLVAHEIAKKGWGHLVDRPCPRQLWEGLERLISDQTYADRLARNALRCANERDSRAIWGEVERWLVEPDLRPDRSTHAIRHREDVALDGDRVTRV